MTQYSWSSVRDLHDSLTLQTLAKLLRGGFRVLLLLKFGLSTAQAALPTEFTYQTGVTPRGTQAELANSELNSQVDTALVGLSVTREEQYGRTTLKIQDGLKFYARLLKPNSLHTHKIIETAIREQYLSKRHRDPVLALGDWFAIRYPGTSIFFATEGMDDHDWATLKYLVSERNLQLRLRGTYAVIGQGFTFHILNYLIDEGDALTEQPLRRSFERNVRHAASRVLAFGMTDRCFWLGRVLRARTRGVFGAVARRSWDFDPRNHA